MSRGQLPRTREFFPRMKVRGGRRRAVHRGVLFVDLSAAFDSLGQFAEALGQTFGAIVDAAAGLVWGFAHLHLPGLVRLAVEADEHRTREYVLSERYQLDRLARVYAGRPLAHSAAVGRFFAARAHRELDALEQSIRVQSLREAWSATEDRYRANALGSWSV